MTTSIGTIEIGDTKLILLPGLDWSCRDKDLEKAVNQMYDDWLPQQGPIRGLLDQVAEDLGGKVTKFRKPKEPRGRIY